MPRQQRVSHRPFTVNPPARIRSPQKLIVEVGTSRVPDQS